MHIPTIREKLSWGSFQLKTSVNGTQVSAATGFFYEFDNREFLITNYHVVSGRHPETGKPLHRMSAIPDSVEICIPTSTQINAEDSGQQPTKMKWEWKSLRLFEDGDDEKPIWTEHPEHGKLFDVVAIPLSGLKDTNILAVNSPEMDLDKNGG